MSEPEVKEISELFAEEVNYSDLLEKLDTVIQNQDDISSKLDTVIEGQAAISNALYSIIGFSILIVAFKLLWTVVAKWLFGGI